MSPVTYEQLFSYLVKLGFRDGSPTKFERVFEHREQRILLAVSMLDDPSEVRAARDADLLSVEFQLQQHGMLDGRLEDVVTRSVREF